MFDSFRRPTRFLALLLIVVVGVALLRRRFSAPRVAPVVARSDHLVHLPDTSTGADIEVETVQGEHVVAGVETTEPTASTEAAETPVPWWVTPDGDACPSSHPVKVKQASGIYHVPGGQNYDRTRPDRCYLSAAAAQNDGYRASKR